MLETIKAIQACQPGEKLSRDTIAAKIVYRHAGYYVAAAARVYLGATPNFLSLLSAAFALFALLVALLAPNIIVISLLLLAIAVLDCADGALARYVKLSGPTGELADAIGGYVVLATVPYVAWLMAYPSIERWGNDSLLLASATGIAVAVHFLGRSTHLKQALSLQNDSPGANENENGNLLQRIVADLSFCGFMFPFAIGTWVLGVPVLAWWYIALFSVASGGAALCKGIVATKR